MKKKISLPVVIAIVLVVSALVFTLAYVIATNNMNKKLNDLAEKQAMFGALADVDSFVRENCEYDAKEDDLQEKTVEGMVKAYDGRVIHLTSEEYKGSKYESMNCKTMTVSDGCVIVVLTEAQYKEFNPAK